MKRVFLVLSCFAVLAAAPPRAADAAALTNEDVVRMVKGGLSEATVLQAIDGAEPAFDTSVDGLVKLKESGVSEAVIQRILARQRGAAPAPPAAVAPACKDCGTITGIREVAKPGRASGAGAVAGGVIGGVIGHQLGGRDHRTAGTVIGAAGGAVAGHVIEKKAREGRTWEVGVKMDDGASRVFHQDSHPSWSAGTRVRVVNGALAPL
jgi:outer membrane lipoprotein SlyB